MFCFVGTNLHTEYVYWVLILWCGIKQRQIVTIFLKLYHFEERQSIGLNASSNKNHEFLYYLIFNCLIVSFFLFVRKWIAGWIKHEKTISVHWPVDRGKCSVASPRGYKRTVAELSMTSPSNWGFCSLFSYCAQYSFSMSSFSRAPNKSLISTKYGVKGKESYCP